jgi:hypothetical protein
MRLPLCMALSALVCSAAANATDDTWLRFNHVDVDPLAQPAARNGFFPTTHAGEGLQFVQFDAPIKAAWRDALEARGLRVLQYYPGRAYLVWGRTADIDAARAAPHVRWHGGLLAEDKIQRDLAGRTGRIRNVDVHFYNNDDVAATLARLVELGATVVTHGAAQPDGAFHDAWIEIDATRLTDIARLPQVVALAYAHPAIGYDDEMAAQIVAGNYTANQTQPGYAPWLAGFGFDGSGVVWGITDTGVDREHPDLAPRIVGGAGFAGCPPLGDEPVNGGHGTHVAGIVAGLGIGDGAGPVDEDDDAGFRYGLGVATGASLFALCTGSAWPPPSGWPTLSRVNLAAGAVGMNASWHSGEGAAHGYQASERTFDAMVRDGNFNAPGNQPLTIVFSAGNSGPGATTITAPKEAKNPITTASMRNFRAGMIDDVSWFSSRGPAVDGRVLPTIAAPGEAIMSTRRRAGGGACVDAVPGTLGHYAPCSGTSMSAPQASGALAVLVQWWRGYHGGADPSPAMAKALLVNGAVDVGTPDVPNGDEGWGRIHLPRSTASPAQRHFVDQSIVIDDVGGSHVANLVVADAARPVRVTLAWTDAPGAVGANPALVNDLDLVVEAAGTPYRGNVLAGGVSVAGGAADNINNVENVFIPAGTNGPLTVTVRAAALPGDGVPASGDATDQDFALICDNCVAGPGYTLLAQPTTRAVCAIGGTDFTLQTRPVLGYAAPIGFSAANVPAGANVAVAPTSVAPGGTAVATFTPGTITPGEYTFDVLATSAAGPRTATFDITVDAPLGNTEPFLPEDGATGIPRAPTVYWAAAANAQTQRLEIATDAAFAHVVDTRMLAGDATSANTVGLLDYATRYYWRITATNACGTDVSPARSFTTEPSPDTCVASFVANRLLFSDAEGDTGGWSTAGSIGPSTWNVSTARPYAGAKSWLAIDLPADSDQRLMSPPVALPADHASLTLSFHGDYALEVDDEIALCRSAALLQVSVDDGATWEYVDDQQMLLGGYTTIAVPEPGMFQRAWCGVRPYTKTLVDLTRHAGSTIRLRWRTLTSPGGGYAPDGWYVDDIVVQSCAPDALFDDGFE